MVGQFVQFFLVTNVKALDRERRLVPRPVQVSHKHADFQFLDRYFPPLYTHDHTSSAELIGSSFCIVSKSKKETTDAL